MSAAPVKVEYPCIEHIPQTPAFDNQDFNMTCIVSGSGDVKVAWLKDGVSVDTGDFAVTTVQVADRHYMYGQTDAKKSTLKWRVTKGARYFTCGNITHFDGHYTCAVTTETAVAPTHDVSKAFIVNVQCKFTYNYAINMCIWYICVCVCACVRACIMDCSEMHMEACTHICTHAYTCNCMYAHAHT